MDYVGKKPYLLMILDGVGVGDYDDGDAFKLAKTPNLDRLTSRYPHNTLEASGLSVGLPDGQMGNSEVGHANIGSGRIIYQELTRINKSIDDGDFFGNKALLGAVNNAKNNNSALHLIGLVSDGGVHSHQNHLYALLKLARDNGLKKVFIHAFLDGRDTSPNSGIDFIKSLQSEIDQIGVGRILTVGGRYYGMDRDNRWDRVELAYDAIVNGKGHAVDSVNDFIVENYQNGIYDEFIKPTVVKSENQDIAINDGDSVIMFNFRPDRARQFAHALADDAFSHFDRRQKKNIKLVTMTNYDRTLSSVEIAYPLQNIENSIGEYIAKLGYSQFRIAETEKYAHVTFFFNGGIEKPFDREDRLVVSSPNVATYDLQPEMSAFRVTDGVIKALESKKYDLIVVNFANGDMVGHTGKLEQSIRAVEALDECVGRIVDKLSDLGGEAIITADHGNCEYMIDPKNGSSITSHSTFDVPVIVVSDRVKSVRHGKLCDISPTMLSIMGLDVPKEMTGHSIIELKKEDII